MNLSRRDCIQLGVLVGLGSSIVGCAPLAAKIADHPKELPLPSGDLKPEWRLLHRAAFGPRPGDLARLHEQGVEAYLKEALKGDRSEQLALTVQLQREDVGQIDDPDLEDLPKGEVIRQLQQCALLRATYGENQLRERLVDFWSNHFNVYARKGDSAFRLGADQRDVIRSHALESFQDLLWASAHSAAMLAFLDNPQNLRQRPNENYARELMELHTLGIGGGYSQKDVQEVARCFTGWTIETRFLRPKGKLRFDPDRHDDGSKLVLGKVIPAGGGERDVSEVLTILATHPSTSHFLARKLVNYFYGEESQSLIDLVAERYRSTHGSVAEMVAPLLQPRVLAGAPPKMKRPFDLIAGAVRSTNGDTDGNNPIQDHLASMGEPLYQWPMPDGYPVKTVAWTGSMLPRWNFAHAFAHGEIRGTGPGKLNRISEGTLGQSKGGEFEGTTDAETLALCLASPDFQWC